jgi:hypothetical protein
MISMSVDGSGSVASIETGGTVTRRTAAHVANEIPTGCAASPGACEVPFCVAVSKARCMRGSGRSEVGRNPYQPGRIV